MARVRTPVDDYLEKQRLMTPAACFSREHDAMDRNGHEPATRRLIPLSKPAEGEQYAFEVNMDACTGCKACVAACHSMNGLDEGEAWRDVGTIVGSGCGEAYTQTVTTACHHCEDPGCLNGCPVKAYEKDPVTGIVHHLDDQCIGCEYCVMKCPYDVPKYNAELGIVRKCDMCHNRLSEGEAPACVQACPTQAISITIVERDNPSAAHRQEEQLVPGAPDSAYTKPTTRFITVKSVPENTRASDEAQLRLQPAHWPLVLMLTLTQASVGVLATDAFLRVSDRQPGPALTLTGLVLCFSGLSASVFHLGKPLKAWRFFLGLRTSWLSREILVFNLFAGLLPLYGLTLFPQLPVPALLVPAIQLATVVTGLAGVLCSIKIYEDTRRPFWKARYSYGKFLGTVAGCALAGLMLKGWWWPLLTVSAMRLSWELTFLSHRKGDPRDNLVKSSRIMAGLLPRTLILRFLAGAAGGILIPLLYALSLVSATFAFWTAIALILAGELAQRYLYFRAVVPLKMPGTLHSHDAH